MGVIHKLTDEVVQFILQQKKDNPSMGCRKLADLVSERYQIKVSKSSVNTILKGHSLSSSVGRPASKTPKERKFSIPKEKKEQLFGKTQAKPSPESQQEIQKPKSLQLMPDPVKPKEKEEIQKPVEASQEFIKAIEIKRQEEDGQKGNLRDHAGVIFIKAALAQMSLPKMMEQLLRQHIKGDFHHKLESICEAIALLRFLDIENETDIYAEQMDIVWDLTDTDIKEPTVKLWQMLKTQKMPKNFDVIFLNELQQQAAEVGFFRFLLEDGTQFMIDAHFSSLEPKETTDAAWPLSKALSLLSKQIVSNNDETIIKTFIYNGAQRDVFFDFVKAYENNKGKALSKVEALDSKKRKLAEFKTIPKKKRCFIGGFLPENEIFKELTKAAKWAGLKPFYEPRIDTICYFNQTATDYFDQHLGSKAIQRAIIIWQEDRKEPSLALISNDSKKSAESIIGNYLMRWPKALKKRDDLTEDDKNHADEVDNTKRSFILSDLLACFDQINEQALKYCTQHHFSQAVTNTNLSHLKTGIYDISGHVIGKEESVKVILTAPKEPSSMNLLSRAVNNVNQGYIFDNKERRLLSILNN